MSAAFQTCAAAPGDDLYRRALQTSNTGGQNERAHAPHVDSPHQIDDCQRKDSLGATTIHFPGSRVNGGNLWVLGAV